MGIRLFFSVICLFGLTSNLQAKEAKSVLQHEASIAEVQQLKQNASYFQLRQYESNSPNWSPAPEISDYGYVLLSSEADFSEAQNLRYTIAKNLPQNVKLVLLVTPSSLDRIKQVYSKYISLDRVIFVSAPDISNGFWARDSFPFPVLNTQSELSLVSAKYYRNFKASSYISSGLSLNMKSHGFTFVGGNLQADDEGTCFTIKSERMFNTTEQDLMQAYGCKKLHVLKHLKGIGDVDEVIKPLGGRVVLTNTKEYISDLQSWGYKVIELPNIPRSYRTYVNSLIVDRKVFMPSYGVSEDEAAKSVYESLGYQVVPVVSNFLSDQLHGSVHCQTMAYPRISEAALLEMLGLEKL